MISFYSNPDRKDWAALTRRPSLALNELFSTVENIYEDLQDRGMKALQEYTRKFDKVQLTDFKVTPKELSIAENEISPDLKKAIQQAYENLYTYHQSQISTVHKVTTTNGITCWRENRAIQRVGFYIPGGTAPLFSTVLMLGIPAKIAGCEEIVLCTPPQKDGQVHPAILYAAKLVGITSIFKLGGIQAILGMHMGIAEIPVVYKIFGPGNQYVMAAKQFVQNHGTAIDMPAGPSEVLVIADNTANPAFVAADLLSQAEHGPDSQVILLANSKELVTACLQEIELQLQQLPRKEIARKALQHSYALYLDPLDACFEFSNQYAPEHLILAIDQAEEQISKIKNAGSVFLGNYSCESAGDYASGTNHTLPTSGYAKAYSGVSVDSFVKKISFQNLTSEGLQALGETITTMAVAEGLEAHRNAVQIRLDYLLKE